MRFSLASQALLGASLASAASISKRQGVVDLDQFGNGFTMLDPEEAKKAAGIDAFFDASLVPEPSQVNSAATNSANDNHDSEAVPAQTAATNCTDPAVRIEWRDMADADKQNFFDAIKILLGAPSKGNYPGAQNRYEDLVVVHQQLTGSIHMVAQFLPWHRWYVHIFEQILRDEGGFTGPMPWWDETKDNGKFANSPLFTDKWFGSAPAKTSHGNGTCITNGAFAGLTLHIGPGSTNSNHCLSRAVNESLTAQCNQNFVNNCNSHANYTEMESCSETGPHAYGHNGIGAVMSEVSASPGDPVFFMHHTFVDHMWHIWQNADPANRLMQINGYSTTSEPKKTLTLDYVLTSQGLRDDITVQDVMDTEGGYLCYRYSY